MFETALSNVTAYNALVETPHLLELYTFSCEEFAQDHRVLPELDTSFLGPLRAFSSELFGCHSSGQGISPIKFYSNDSTSVLPLIQSENSVSSLLEHVMAKEEPGLSIELWFTPSSVNESIWDTTPEEETICHGIQDRDICEYFAQSSYMHGPISCSWFESDEESASLTGDSYCGFPGNRFAVQDGNLDPWIPPIRHCNHHSKNKDACERSHFFVPQPCYWNDDDQCRPRPSFFMPPKLPLISIAEGDLSERDANKGCSGTGHNFDFRIVQKGRSFTVSHSGVDKWTCNFNYNPLKMMMPREPELTQVVVAMNDTMSMGTSVFMNGKLVERQPFSYEGIGGFEDWNPTMLLQLFSDYDTLHLRKTEAAYMPPFLGGIHLLAIYDKQLTEDDVKVAYTKGKQFLSYLPID